MLGFANIRSNADAISLWSPHSFLCGNIGSGNIQITTKTSIEPNPTKAKVNVKKTDHVPSTMARIGAEPIYTSQDEPQEKFVVYFENPEGLGEGVADLQAQSAQKQK